METSTLSAARGMLQLLGFEFAADKLEDPATVAVMLGVELDSSERPKGVTKVRNKQSRISELKEAFATICREGSYVPAQLPPLLGRMQFADHRTDSRTKWETCHGRLASPWNYEHQDIEIREIRCGIAGPKTGYSGTPNAVQKPFIIFRDGALEYEGIENQTAVATVGIEVIDPSGSACAAGSSVFCRAWSRSSKGMARPTLSVSLRCTLVFVQFTTFLMFCVHSFC